MNNFSATQTPVNNGQAIKQELRRLWNEYGTKAFVSPDNRRAIEQVGENIDRLEDMLDTPEAFASFMTSVCLLFSADKTNQLLMACAASSQAIQEIDQIRTVVNQAREQRAAQPSGGYVPRSRRGFPSE